MVAMDSSTRFITKLSVISNSSAVGGQLFALEDVADSFQQRRIPQLFPGEVHGHDPGIQPLLLPGHELPARLLQHLLAQLHDEPGLLRQQNEPLRSNRSQLWITPAREHLQAHQPAILQAHLRLVMNLERIGFHGPAQRGFHHGTLHGFAGHLLVIELGRCCDPPPWP